MENIDWVRSKDGVLYTAFEFDIEKSNGWRIRIPHRIYSFFLVENTLHVATSNHLYFVDTNNGQIIDHEYIPYLCYHASTKWIIESTFEPIFHVGSLSILGHETYMTQSCIVAIDVQGDTLAAACNDGSLRIVDLTKRNPLRHFPHVTLSTHFQSVHVVPRFENRVVGTDILDNVFIVDLETDKIRWITWRYNYSSEAQLITFSRDATLLLLDWNQSVCSVCLFPKQRSQLVALPMGTVPVMKRILDRLICFSML